MSKFKKLTIVLISLVIGAVTALTLVGCGQVEFKVRFMVDDTVYATIATKGNEKIKLPKNPKKEGYTFDGWYWDEDVWQEPFTANSLLDAPLSENMSVYAKFIEDGAIKGTDIALDGYTLEGGGSGEIYKKVLPYETTLYRFYDDVTVHPLSSWTVSFDVSGNNVIASKSVELTLGDNIFYILVTDAQNNIFQYKVNVYRESKKVDVPKVDTTKFIYNGKPQTYVMPMSEFYTISGKAVATNAGKYTITLALKPNCIWSDGTKGNKVYDFVIEPFDASGAKFTVEDIEYGETPVGIVELDGFTLKEGVDYDIRYHDYSQVCEEMTAEVYFKGNFTGVTGDIYAITECDASDAKFTVSDIFYGKKPSARVIVNGNELIEGTDYDVDYGDYSKITESVTATATFKGNYYGTATTTYKVKSFEKEVEVFLDFDENIDNKGCGAVTTSMLRGSETYADGVNGQGIVINPKTSAVLVDGLNIGTDSFTIAFNVKIDPQFFSNMNNDYELVSSINTNVSESGMTNDYDPRTFQWSANGSREPDSFRIQIGRNGSSNAWYFSKGTVGNQTSSGIVAGTWQQWILVLERNVEYDATHTLSMTKYNSKGEYDATINQSTFSAPEKAVLSLYLDGELFGSRELWYTEGQTIGMGDLVIGGRRATKNNNFTMDNFMFIRSAIGQDQIEDLASYVNTQSAKNDFSVSNVSFSAIDVEKQNNADGGYVADLIITSRDESKDLTGAMLVDAPDGITLVSGQNAGEYKLNFTADVLNSLDGEVKFGVKLGDGLRYCKVSYLAFKQEIANTLKTSAIAYYDFDGNVTNQVDGVNATVRKRFASSTEGEAVYADDNTAYVANMLQRSLTMEKVSLGTKSFTVSALINGKDLKENTIQGSGHATILFGTADVDTTNEGFSVRLKYDGTIQVKVHDKYVCNVVAGIPMSTLSDDYSRWTFVFDRSSNEQFVFKVYVEGKLIFVNTTKATDNNCAMVSLDTAEGKLGIGGAGTFWSSTTGYTANRGTAEIRFGDFAIYEGLLDEKLLDETTYQMYVNSIFKGISVSDVTYTFIDKDANGNYVVNLAIESNNSDVSTAGATLVKAPNGITLTETDGVYTLTCTAEAFALLEEVQTLTLKVADQERSFKVYKEDFLHLSKTKFNVTVAEVVDEKVNITIGVYADATLKRPIKEKVVITQGEKVIETTTDGNGNYTFSVFWVDIANDGLDFTVNYADGEVDAVTFNVKQYIASTEGVIFSLDSKTLTYYVSGYEGTAKRVYVASSYNDKPVTRIGDGAFLGKNITSVEMEDSITIIGYEAFSGCEFLSNVKMSNAVTVIEDKAFYDCYSLTNIEIPNCITDVGRSAFSGCNLNYNVKDGVKYLGNAESPYVYLIGTTSEDITGVTISDTCRIIGDSAFYECAITDLIIPDSVVRIKTYAFSFCDVENVKIGSGVTVIENDVFVYTYIKSIIIPKNVTTMGANAIYDGPIEIIYCEAESKPSGWANNWNTHGIIVWGYDYTTVDGITYGIKNGEASVVRQCAVTTADLVSTVTYNGQVFDVTTIADEAFYECKQLTKVELPNGITKIGTNAFAYCDNLVRLTIPTGVTSMAENAIYRCPNLRIYCAETVKPRTWDTNWNPFDVHVEWNYTA